MARGWESKAVEAQQEAARDGRSAAVPRQEDIVRARRRATLMLARTRALSDLQLACAVPHRRMLEQAIADIDRQLTELQ